MSAGGGRHRLAVSDGGFAVATAKAIHAGAVGSGVWTTPISHVHALALTSTELWVVSGSDTQLERRSIFDGTSIAVPIVLPPPGPGAQLVPAPNDGVAVWRGVEIVEIDGRGGKAIVTAMPNDVTHAVPLRAGRWVVSRGSSVQLLDGGTMRWESRDAKTGGLPMLGGSGMDGGRTVALALGRDRPREIVLLDALTGAVRRRYTLQAIADVRFAARHQLAVMRSQRGDVVALDLETGRSRSFGGECAALDAAIGPSGRWLGVLEASEQRLRVRGWELSGANAWTLDLDEAAPAEPAIAAVDAGDAGEASIVADADVREAPVAAAVVEDDVPLVRVPDAPPRATRRPIVTALRPRTAGPHIEPREARAILELQLRAVASWCELAMAQALDSDLVQVPIEHALEFVRRLQGLVGGSPQAGERTQLAQRHVRGTMLALQRARKALGANRTPIDDLVQDFGLSALAGDILLVVAAPVLWGELADVYAMLGDRGRPSCYELLICKILGFPPSMRHEIATELHPWSPLVRAGLVLVADDRPRPFASVFPEPLVIERLRAMPIEQRGDSWARPRAVTCELDQVIAPPGVIEAIANAAPNGDRPLRLVLRGRRGAGRRTALAAIAAEAGRTIGDIDVPALATDGRNVAEHLARELRRTTIRGWIPCLTDADRGGKDDHELAHVRRALDDHPGPLALRLDPDVTPPLSPGYTLVDFPTLDDDARLAWWRAVLARRDDYRVADIDALAARYRIGPGIIAEVAASCAASDEPLDHGLGRAIQQHLEDRLGDVAQRVRHLASWKSLILAPEVEDSLRELISRVRWSRRVFEQWGFAQSAGNARGIVALFHGLPGTGKTMAAGAIARELDVEMYRIDLSRVMSKWIGETERNLANVFAAAEESQAIVLFDEADSLFAKRTEVRSSVDRYANLEVNYILQRLDSFEGIAILTSNHLAGIDPAFRRRLTVEVNFPFPDEETREQLWRVHLPKGLPERDTIDVRGMARRYQLSGGYIRNAALRAAFLAAEEGVMPTHEHFERAVRLQYAQAGKFSSGGTLE